MGQTISEEIREDKRKALAEHLNISPDLVEFNEFDFSLFTVRHVMRLDEEYLVFTNSEADKELEELHADAEYAVTKGYLKNWQRGHRGEHLAPYDAVERKQGELFIYRTS